MSVDELLKKLHAASGQSAPLDIVYSDKLWAGSSSIKGNQITISKKIKDNKDANSLARSAIIYGLFLLRENHESTVAWRQKMVKSGYVLPVFVMMVALFTSLVGKLPFKIALAAIAAAFGFTTTMLWFSMPVEKEAGNVVIDLIEKQRLFPRLREEEAVINAIKATCWTSLMPGSLRGFMTAYKPAKSPNP